MPFFIFLGGKRLHAQRLEHASSTHRARAENAFVLLAKIHLCLGKPVHLGMIPFAPAVPRRLTFLPEHCAGLNLFPAPVPSFAQSHPKHTHNLTPQTLLKMQLLQMTVRTDGVLCL